MSIEAVEALHTLRSSQPSERWTDAFPIGDGRRAAMCAGLSGGERLWLNDITAWSGLPGQDPLRGIDEAGTEPLYDARAALAQGEPGRAERMLRRQQSPWAQAYLPLGIVDIELDGVRPAGGTLRRRLDLGRAIAAHEYDSSAGMVRHESWADAAAGAIVHRITSDSPVALRVTVSSLLHSLDRTDVGGSLRTRWKLPVDVAPGHEQTPEPIRYAADGRVGTITVTSVAPSSIEDGALITGASSTHLLLIRTETSPAISGFAGRAATIDTADGPDAAAQRLRRAHITSHRELYDRCILDLPSAADAPALPTAERIRRAQERPDEGLAALAFHYGRYLLISSSRGDGDLPLTLQGIWNAELPGPWSSAYTTNINLQMAYWPAEVTGLSECHRPLLRFVRRVSETTGPVVARDLHGADGWAMHHNSDAWGHAAPVGNGAGDAAWAFWPMGGIWLSTHLWEAYAFTPDDDWLRAEAWPVLEATGRFASSWIQTDGRRAWTSPSTSPENHYLDAARRPRALTESSTMDVSLLRELAAICRSAADALGLCPDWVVELERRTRLLPDPRVDAEGHLAEWATDVEDAEPHHRHLSHLVGLYPFAQITPRTSPELAAAASESILGRGAESTGWALAWRLAMWARLGSGTRVHDQLRLALRPAADPALGHRGGLYANMFSAHPPFQIDGNLGLTAGIAEALLQSHERDDAGIRRLRVLPALPDEWPDGSVCGLRARGGITVDVRWAAGRIAALRLRSMQERTVVVGGPGMPEEELMLRAGEETTIPSKESSW